MINREKLQNGLKGAADFIDARESMAVDEGKMLLAYWGVSVRTAMAILEDQIPRVLTIEQLRDMPVDEMCSVPVVIEEKYPIETWDKGSHFKWCGSDFVVRAHLRESHLVGVYITEETYGKVWRVWSWMPTRDQAEEAEWDG